MQNINRKKKRSVIHVRVRSTSINRKIPKKHSKNKSFPSSVIHHQQSNIAPEFIHSSFAIDHKKYESRHAIKADQQSTINNGQDTRNLSWSNRTAESILSVSHMSSNKNKINRVTPIEKKRRKIKYCGIPLWLLISLICGLIALLASIVAVTIYTFTKSEVKSSSATITGTSTTTTSSTSVSTTSTTASTTTTFFTCSNFTVKPNWDYNLNDIMSQSSQTFASCCAWCLNVTACAAFTFNPWNDCLLKNSTGTGGNSYPNSIGAAR